MTALMVCHCFFWPRAAGSVNAASSARAIACEKSSSGFFGAITLGKRPASRKMCNFFRGLGGTTATEPVTRGMAAAGKGDAKAGKSKRDATTEPADEDIAITLAGPCQPLFIHVDQFCRCNMNPLTKVPKFVDCFCMLLPFIDQLQTFGDWPGPVGLPFCKPCLFPNRRNPNFVELLWTIAFLIYLNIIHIVEQYSTNPYKSKHILNSASYFQHHLSQATLIQAHCR